ASNGEAREYWTLGPAAGSQVVEARAVDPVTGAKRVFARFEALAVQHGCLGDCTGAELARDGRECFNESDASSLEDVALTVRRNGDDCPPGQIIRGVRLIMDGDCIRVPSLFCAP